MDFFKTIVRLFKVYVNWSEYSVRSSDKHIVWKDCLNFEHDSTIDTLEKDLDNFERYYVHLKNDDIQ